MMLLSSLPVLAQAQQADSSIFDKPLKLDASVKTERVARSEQKGDTLLFNAAAYQVAENADSERLVSKMPGISVSDSGVEANGKEVARVLLDGQEFFGSDVLSALRNVPADMVKQIEVINRLSEQAQLTGVDDGEGYTALNIVTKRKKGAGLITGRVYGSYGYSDRKDCRNNYIAGGNFSRFTDKNSLSVIGMSNNISKFNFVSSDILSGAAGLDTGGGSSFKVKSLSGLSDVHSLGVNYTSKKCNLTYFFNDISNRNRPVSDKYSMTSTEGKELLTHNENDYHADNMTHKLNGKITLNPSSRHSFIIRPSLTFEDMLNGRNLYGAYRYIYKDAEDKFVRRQMNVNDNDRWSLRASTEVSYRYRFAKRKRSLSVYGKYLYYRYSAADSSWEYRWKSEDQTDYDPSTAYYTYIQTRSRLTSQHQVTGKLTYTEPLTRRSQLSAEYTFYMTDAEGENLAFPFKDGQYSKEPVERTSAINRSSFYHNRVGLRYNYAFRKMSVTAAATYQNLVFEGMTRLPAEGMTSRVYHHPLYIIIANLPFDKSNKLRVELRGKTQNPTTSMLQNIVDRSSTSNVRSGNPDIDPAYLHVAELQYVNTNKKAGTTFSVSASYTGSSNYFCDSLVINSPGYVVDHDENGIAITLKEGDQFVKPINLPGYRKISFKTSFAVPLDFIRCNFNIGMQTSLQRLPGMINEDYVPINRNWYQVFGRLDSNISKDVDFTISYLARYNSNDYSGKYGRVQNNYVSHRALAHLRLLFLKNFTFTGAFVYKKEKSTRGLYDDDFYLCDLFLGYRFLKNRRLEVSVGVNDLFDNNVRSYWHSVNASGRTDGENLGVGRYYSLQCIWHFRHGTRPKKIVQ